MSKQKLKFLITQGKIKAIYSDELLPILRRGKVKISRASHVEPAPGGGWTADLSPVNGPVLGPFPLRETALQAEKDWLEQELYDKA